MNPIQKTPCINNRTSNLMRRRKKITSQINPIQLETCINNRTQKRN